jgi:pimeloyl-ACP methyl ester carboxylesterase
MVQKLGVSTRIPGGAAAHTGAPPRAPFDTLAAMIDLSSAVQAWRARGRRIAVGGNEMFVVDEGAGDPPVVLLHGFPTSSFDWRACADHLKQKRRVVTFDFLGFGLSDKPQDYSYSLIEQADSVAVVLRELGVRRAHLVAHDMGTSVAAELLARKRHGLLPFELASLTLTNGSVYIEMAHLTPSQQLLRLPILGSVFARASSFSTFRLQVRRILRRSVAEQELRDMFDLILHNDGKPRLAHIIDYIDERRRFAERWTGHLRELDLRTLILWGVHDPVAVIGIGERLAREIPGARLERLEDVGHFTPLEAPDLVSAHLERFFDDVER